MRSHKFWRSVVVGLAALGIAGCVADTTTGPETPSQAAPGLLGDLPLVGSLLEVKALPRKTPLSQNLTASATIGSAGGTISIKQAGFTLTVPKGAVSTNTKFTVTALAGNLVAYEMAPHGLVFAKPLVARQDLKVTKWNGLPLPLLKGAYYTDKSLLNQLLATAKVAELIDGTTNFLTWNFDWKIGHFSGYTVAW